MATPSSLLLATATTSKSRVSMGNDEHGLPLGDGYDEGSAGLMIGSDDGESLTGAASPSMGDAASPSLSNAPNDSDSHEQ